MKNIVVPTYKFKPPNLFETRVQLRTCSNRRARLWAGGTYFRSRDLGRAGNNISIEVVEVYPASHELAEAYCVITNHNLKATENIVGAEADVFELTGTYQDLWKFEGLSTPTPLVRKYSISVQIRNRMRLEQPYTLPTPIDRSFTPGRLFFVQGEISLKTTKSAVDFAASDVISVQQRFRMYPLLKKITTTAPAAGDTGPGTSNVGWDIDDLRVQVNANDPWVEMIARGELKDKQDDREDDPVLSAFAATRLKNGDGLPDNPSNERTGPCRALVHINSEEMQDGGMSAHNTVYEWVGDSAIAGAWKPY
jgi:hypothetical protein